MSPSLTIRISDDTAKRLDALAKSLDRPKSYIVKKAMETYIEEYSDYLIAVKRLNDKDDAILGSRELRERLARKD
ncbi:MAG: ribbon-helix-helix domain-containing protein [Methanomicrobiales archaeon]|nr:ribbon-helix-helix domain-containing protein [Methanomicrobiales archaeon]MDD1669056.1 ribbon-helix-helix domain-containing protein [Methanomicrobiales archaeon]